MPYLVIKNSEIGELTYLCKDFSKDKRRLSLLSALSLFLAYSSSLKVLCKVCLEQTPQLLY